MINLPVWRLTNRYPAFYDTESGTAIEQTAKVYAAMQELIKEHNDFVAEIQKHINDHDASTAAEYSEFKSCMTQLMENYIVTIDEKVRQLQIQIDAINKEVAGVKIEYDELTESLNIGGTE